MTIAWATAVGLPPPTCSTRSPTIGRNVGRTTLDVLLKMEIKPVMKADQPTTVCASATCRICCESKFTAPVSSQ